jgi:beta-lactamase regulating signal transducer with metallopeptidase domain
MKVDTLAESAVRITVLSLGVAVVLRTLQVRSPRFVHGAWTVVVVVMLLLPVFVAWGPEFEVPVLPSHTMSGMRAPAAGEVAVAEHIRGTASPATDGAQRRMTWAAAAMTVYVAGVGLFLLRLAMGLRRARAIRRNAVQVQGRLTHPACVTPMAVGIVAPAVVLPPDWANWDDAELSAVLAHEEEHVRRRDPLVTVVALLNRAVFWFHPLAWWLQREIARLSEHACDAVVISRGHDRDVYSACLLRFARRASDAGGRIAPIATAMPGAGLPERLGMLAHPQVERSSRSRLFCVAVACVALVAVCAAAAPTAAPVQNVPSPARVQAVWSVDTSEHFEIFHDGLPADRVSDAVRDAEAAYSQLSAALKHDLPRRVPIILVRRDRDLSVTAVFDLALQNGASARQRLVISLESLDRREGVIVHELTHQFAFDIIPVTSRVAPVLIEGLAEHQRGAWTAEELRATRAAVAIGAIPSVASLDATDRHWAHAAFDFVAAQHGAEGVRQLLFGLRVHETLVQAVPMAFGVTLDQFDQGFRGYVTTTFGPP